MTDAMSTERGQPHFEGKAALISFNPRSTSLPVAMTAGRACDEGGSRGTHLSQLRCDR